MWGSTPYICLVSTKCTWLTHRVDSARRCWVSLSFSLNRATSARAIALIPWLPSPWESFSLSISAFNSVERKNKLHQSEVFITTLLRLIMLHRDYKTPLARAENTSNKPLMIFAFGSSLITALLTIVRAL